MKTLLLSLAIFCLVAVAPVSAGGDPDQLGANLFGGTDVGVGQGVSGAESTSTAMEAANMADSSNQLAAADRSATFWKIGLAVALVAIAGGLLWSYRRNKATTS